MSNEETVGNSWFNKRPLPVFIIVCYCILKFIMLSKFVVAEALPNLHFGIISGFGFLVYVLPTLILGIAAILLFFKKKLSINLLWLVFIIVILKGLAASTNNQTDLLFSWVITVQDMSLLFGSIIYGYHLKTAGYFCNLK